ncbi:hypothetical protein AQUCO_09200004v1 [Aquilegia coerulea]|uniref:Uncharacterized protein n=1 Tax=Aquilegia coerulea TaxID=218851 RepID=A0A2G5C6R6_AQUCA|nr:hypothetical protein AQUCO_09200004v1 [Aquilegia coerulea]
MAMLLFSRRNPKLGKWRQWSKYTQQQRARLYIIWRCTVILVCWQE